MMWPMSLRPNMELHVHTSSYTYVIELWILFASNISIIVTTAALQHIDGSFIHHILLKLAHFENTHTFGKRSLEVFHCAVFRNINLNLSYLQSIFQVIWCFELPCELLNSAFVYRGSQKRKGNVVSGGITPRQLFFGSRARRYQNPWRAREGDCVGALNINGCGW